MVGYSGEGPEVGTASVAEAAERGQKETAAGRPAGSTGRWAQGSDSWVNVGGGGGAAEGNARVMLSKAKGGTIGAVADRAGHERRLGVGLHCCGHARRECRRREPIRSLVRRCTSCRPTEMSGDGKVL